MITVGWPARIGIVLSALWLLFVIAVAVEGSRVSAIAGFGMVPLAVLWGCAWAFQGYRSQRAKRQPSDVSAPRIGTGLQLLIAAAVIAAGVFTASELLGRSVAYLSGQWIVPGIIAYGLLRSISKSAPYAIVAGSMIYAAGLAGHALHQANDERDLLAELGRATPLLIRLGDSVTPSEGEILSARLGRFEQVVRIYAHMTSSVAKENALYLQALEEAQLPGMLEPASLLSPAQREASRNRIATVRADLDRYVSQVSNARSSALDQLKMLDRELPKALAAGFHAGAQVTNAKQLEWLEQMTATQRASLDEVLGLIDLMESVGPRAKLVGGDSPNIMFARDSDLDAYQQAIQRLTRLVAQEAEIQELALQHQRDSARNLINHVSTGGR